MDAISATLLVASVLLRETPAPNTGAPADSALLTTNVSSTAVVAAATPSATPHGAPDDFAATTDPPWNPPERLNRRRGWERAILFPQRVVTYPLSIVGAGSDWALRKFENTNYFAKLGVEEGGGDPRPLSERSLVLYPPKRLGLEVGPARLGDHTGTGVRVNAHAPVFPGRWRSLAFVEHHMSTAHYHQTRIGLSGDLGGIEYDYEWRPQDRFFGLGMETSKDGISTFASQWDQLRVTLQYVWNRRPENSKPRSNVAIWAGPRSIVTKSGREAGEPSIEDVYPDLVDQTFKQRHEHFIYGGRFATDWRSGIPHLSSGWRVLVQSERYDEPHGIFALHTNHGAAAQFTRTQVELESMWSFMRDPRTIRVMARVVDLGITNGIENMEVLDFARLGGTRTGLAGFEAGRFHDIDAVYGRAMYIFPLVRRLEMDLHAETGQVTPDVWRKTRIDAFEFSSGFAFRLRARTRTYGQAGVDFSHEGSHFRFSLGYGE